MPLSETLKTILADCHRMIYRSNDPSNLSLFKKNLAPIKS